MATLDEHQLRDRAHDLYEREQQLLAAVSARTQQLDALHAQLAAGRDQLRQDKATQETALAARMAKLRRMRDRVRPLHEAARHDRQKARTLLARFLRHMKTRWAAERQAVAADRAEADRHRRAVDQQSAAFLADQTRFAAEAAAYQQRLKDAWELLTEGQRRLIADREQAEKTLAERNALLDTRTGDVEAREQALADGRSNAEARIRDKLAEADRIDARILRAREVLAELEAKRTTAGAMTPVVGSLVPPPDVVALDRRIDGASIDRVFAELQARDRDLTREKYHLATVKAEVERRAAGLADERAVLAEQVATLVVARDRLHADHRQALTDLESAARTVQAMEVAAESRMRAAIDAERRNKKREADLVQFRLRLDAWQANLAAHEETAAAARATADAELTARRSHLERWEAALTTLCHKWAAARKLERAALHDEFARWSTARATYASGLLALDRQRADFLAQAAAAAEVQLAAERVKEELAAGGRTLPRTAARRLEVLRRKWQGHFARFRSDLDARRQSLVAEAVSAGERVAELHRVLAEVADRRTELTGAERRAEADHLARERQLDDRAAVLPLDLARAERSEVALAMVRDEVERVAAAVMASGPEKLVLSPATRPALRAAA